MEYYVVVTAVYTGLQGPGAFTGTLSAPRSILRPDEINTPLLISEILRSQTISVTQVSLVGAGPYTATPGSTPISSIGLSSAITSPAQSSAQTSTSVPATTSLQSASQVSSSATNSGPSAASTASLNGSSGSDNTGLKAGLGVIAGLLAIALVAIAFLLFRRKRTSRNHGSTTLGRASGADPESNESTAKAFSEKASGLGAVVGVELGARRLHSGLDDKAVNAKFAKLDSQIQDWVASTFKSAANAAPEMVGAETVAILTKSCADWKSLLTGDQRSRFLLLRGLVAAILCDAWNSGELVGDRDIAAVVLKFSGSKPTPETTLWRAQTFSLLATQHRYTASRSSAIDRLTSSIESHTSSLYQSASMYNRSSRLRSIVQNASDLALELGQQEVLFAWGTPINGTLGENFDAREMEDVLQEQEADRLDGRTVRALIFPGIGRWGDEEGNQAAWETALVVRKGLVLA